MEQIPGTSADTVVREPAVRGDMPPFRWPAGWGSDFGPLDRPSPEAFDRLARLASHLLRVPSAYIAVARGHTQQVRGWETLPSGAVRRQLPLDGSISERVIASAEPLAISDFDAYAAERQVELTPEFDGRAFLSVPLISTKGIAFGALTVCDPAARRWGGEDVSALRDLAASAATEIELALLVTETERRADEAELARRQRTALLEAVPQGIFGFDADARCTFINRAASQMLGCSPTGSLDRDVHDLLQHRPADDAAYPAGSRPITDTLSTGTGVRLPREFVARSDGSTFLAEVSVEPVTVGGHVTGGVVTFADITDRDRVEAQRRFLATASHLLAASLDYETTLSSVPRLAVPNVADACIVYILQPDRRIERLAMFAADDRRHRLLQELRASVPIALDSPGNSVARVMRSGTPELFPQVSVSELEAASDDPKVRALLEDLAIRSLLVVPLSARGRTLGAMAFIMSESGRQYDGADLDFAHDVAGRAALAIDNAVLFGAASAARQQAESANEAKSAFLAVMSHELRTPLSAILGYAELLADGITGPITESQQEQLGRVKTCAGHLLGLIDEILSFARLEAEREEVRLDIVELAAMTRVAAALVEPLAREKCLAYHVDLPVESITIETDPGKVGQILVHLLGNAVKFTREGHVKLEVSRHGEWLHFAVSDTGIGIEPQHRERIFERFWQAEHPVTRAATGTGIGLTVAQRLAQLLGGTIDVESVVGTGSTFTLRLPCSEVRAPVY